jgi:hypothetical protein
LPVFVASVIGAGLFGSYTVIVVFVWVVMFIIICCDVRHVPTGFSTGFSTSCLSFPQGFPQVGEFST